MQNDLELMLVLSLLAQAMSDVARKADEARRPLLLPCPYGRTRLDDFDYLPETVH